MATDNEKKAATYQRYLKWKASNPTKCSEYQKQYNAAYRSKNRALLNEGGRERQRRRRIEYPERVRASETAYRQRSAEKERDRKRRWKSENPASVKLKKINRKRMLKRLSLFLITPESKMVMNQIYAASRRVSKCTGIMFHVDHIIPLAKDGPHVPANLQILPAIINIRKSAKLLLNA